MWLGDAPAVAGQDAQTAVILAVIGLVTAALVAVAPGVFALLSARANRSENTRGHGDSAYELHERVAVLERRADDNDERDDVQDRRHDQVERALDLDNPDWRHREP